MLGFSANVKYLREYSTNVFKCFMFMKKGHIGYMIKKTFAQKSGNTIYIFRKKVNCKITVCTRVLVRRKL